MNRSALSLFVCSAITCILLACSRPAWGQHDLGSNLDTVTDYSPQLPFLNIFLNSRPWFTQCNPDGDPGCSWNNAWDTNEARLISLDSSGWVRSLPSRAASPVFTSVATYWDVPAGFPNGRYIVLYDGAGTMSYGIGADKITAQSRAGRDVISVNTARGGILLRITATDPNGTGNYIRNIRVVAEADEAKLATTRFSAHFLAQLRPYRALRFMDWMRTNGSIVSSWSGRALPTDARYSTDQGVPVEVMLELANAAGKDPWFNIPHQADDTYVRNFAAVVNEQLSPSQKVYVEYSNEVWNSAFPQSEWIEDRGRQQWPNSSESGFTKRINWHGKRSAEVCDIFRSVFGASSTRVVCVMASQAANSWTAEEALLCPLWSDGPCVLHGINSVAIAPYFGDYVGQEANYSKVLAWTRHNDGGLQSLFNELGNGGVLRGGPSGGALAQSFEWLDANRAVANRFGLDLLAYEGGQHLVGIGLANESEALTTLFTRANRDPRMKALYARYLEGWYLRGGDLFMHFSDIGTYTRWGSWGSLETIGQLSSPKYDALTEYALGVAPQPTPTPTPQPTPTPTPSIDDPVLLSVSRPSGGEVSNSRFGIVCGTQCSVMIDRNARLSLSARPRRGFVFSRWSGACSHSRRTCSITMDEPKSVSAIFRRR